jgi:hypothetical protein
LNSIILFRKLPIQPETLDTSAAAADDMIVDEYGYSLSEEGQWIDVPDYSSLRNLGRGSFFIKF